MTDPLPEDTLSRRRQFRIYARSLRSYSAKLYRMANRLGDYADGTLPKAADNTIPWQVIHLLNRYGAIRPGLESLVRFVSQFLVQQDLEDADTVELHLRLADVQEAIKAVYRVAIEIIRAEKLQFNLGEDPSNSDTALRSRPSSTPRRY